MPLIKNQQKTVSSGEQLQVHLCSTPHALSRLKYATFVHAPSEEELFDACGGIVLEGQRGKYLLPTVILEDIRK